MKSLSPPRKGWRKKASWLGLGMLGGMGLYTAALAWLYVNQDKLVFYPEKVHPLGHLFFERFGERARRYELVQSGHPTLRGWYIGSSDENPSSAAHAPEMLASDYHLPPSSQTLVLYFGGNAEHIDNVLYMASNIPEVSMIAMHYRGYGLSEGRPSEEALYVDALRLVDQVHKEFPEKRIVVFGRSLGSGVALYAAAHRPDVVGHVILSTPYDSVEAVAKRHYAWVPVRQLLKHKFDSMRLAGKIHAPVTMITAGKDDLIPRAHAYNLFQALGSLDKQWIEVEQADHRTIHDWNRTWRGIRQRLARVEYCRLHDPQGVMTCQYSLPLEP